MSIVDEPPDSVSAFRASPRVLRAGALAEAARDVVFFLRRFFFFFFDDDPVDELEVDDPALEEERFLLVFFFRFFFFFFDASSVATKPTCHREKRDANGRRPRGAFAQAAEAAERAV
jgi:hypothetical protein